MGKIRYDATSTVDFDDRVMAHLQLVIGQKLRRNESFWFSWTSPVSAGSGRVSIWVHPAIPLEFTFSGGRYPTINRAWVEEMILVANTSTGLRVIDEPSPNATDPQ